MKPHKNISFVAFVSLILILGQTGCKEDFLDEQPLAQLSEASFWNSEADAKLALTGIYNQSNVSGVIGYTNHPIILSSLTDDSGYKFGAVGIIYSGYLRPADSQVVREIWQRAYRTIFQTNYFLENIERVEMDANKKAEFIAEVRFLRAYEYYYMSIFYGGVPLITNVLSAEEANNQTRNSLEEVVNFAIDELTAAAADLPATRTENEKGRIIKSAPLAVKGRLLMIHKRWSEAAATYKEIIDLNAHIIDPRYKAIFEEAGENNKETILSANNVAGLFGNGMNQLFYHPEFFGGYSASYLYQGFIDAFLMKDGLSIEVSPMYDPENPFDNRDPRLYASVFLPEYTVFRDQLYLAHPDLTDLGVATQNGATGYGYKKFVTEGYTGDQFSSGDDRILIRYAEVLLGYLESKLENGDNITQELLDQTINLVRGREEVNMPAVTETNPAELREIVRRERRVEFCMEHNNIIRYIDIRRWGIFMEVMNRQFYGMKLTDDPENYTDHTVETTGRHRGHYKVIDKTGSITPEMALLPIPLSEIDINPNLEQNPGY